MAYEHKSAWIMAVIAVVGYAGYLVVVLGRAGGGPLVDVAYVAPMLWTMGLAIVGSIVIHIVVGMFAHRDLGKDQRDKEIGRFGDHVGQSFLVVGALAGLIMAMAEFDHFWIANALFLGFHLSALLGSIARIFAYQRGFPW